MPTRISLRLAAICAVALVCAAALIGVPPTADAGGGPLVQARKQSFATFRQTARTAEKTFLTAAANLSRGLSKGTTDAETAATGFGDALGFYAISVKAAADDATAAAADAFSDELVAAGDDDLDGAQAGDGGQLDGFLADVEKEMERLRARATKKARKFARTMQQKGGARVRMRVTLSPWTPDRLAVPTAGGAGPVGERPLRLFGAVVTRLTDGRVIASAFGAADTALHNSPDPAFDVRLQGLPQLPLGDFLSDGGMPVTPDGGWRVTVDLGLALVEGNRAVLFGTEPEEQGLAGLQPTRLVHAGVLSVP